MAEDVADAKRRLRRLLAERRRAVADAEARAVAGRIAAILAAEPRVRRASRVGLYAAVHGEVPSRPLFEALTDVERLLPRVRGRRLEWARVEDWDALVPGPFGIPAPPPDAPAEILRADDAVLVPGLAFDARGWRLGRGGGFYDRAFPPGRSAPLLVGVAHAFQVLEAIPHDSRDRRVDAIVTERGMVWVEAP